MASCGWCGQGRVFGPRRSRGTARCPGWCEGGGGFWAQVLEGRPGRQAVLRRGRRGKRGTRGSGGAWRCRGCRKPHDRKLRPAAREPEATETAAVAPVPCRASLELHSAPSPALRGVKSAGRQHGSGQSALPCQLASVATSFPPRPRPSRNPVPPAWSDPGCPIDAPARSHQQQRSGWQRGGARRRQFFTRPTSTLPAALQTGPNVCFGPQITPGLAFWELAAGLSGCQACRARQRYRVDFASAPGGKVHSLLGRRARHAVTHSLASGFRRQARCRLLPGPCPPGRMHHLPGPRGTGPR